jgi:hypothetical protein
MTAYSKTVIDNLPIAFKHYRTEDLIKVIKTAYLDGMNHTDEVFVSAMNELHKRMNDDQLEMIAIELKNLQGDQE